MLSWATRMTCLSYPQIIIYTQTVHRTKQLLIGKSAGRALSLRLYPGICLITEENTENLSQGSQRMPVGTMKTIYRLMVIKYQLRKHNYGS